MPTGKKDRSDVPHPVRGERCRDFWQVPDAVEVEQIRQRVADFDARTAAVAVGLQREERRERKRRERKRQRRQR
jgi:hypothetical protein